MIAAFLLCVLPWSEWIGWQEEGSAGALEEIGESSRVPTRAPTAARQHETRTAKHALTAQPSPTRIVDISDEHFFTALDFGDSRLAGVAKLVERANFDQAWLEFDRFLRRHWMADAGLIRVAHLKSLAPELEPSPVVIRARALSEGEMVVRGLRVRFGSPMDWLQGAGKNAFAALHSWDWADDLWHAYSRTRDDAYAEIFDRHFRSWYEARHAISNAADFDPVWYELGLARRLPRLVKLYYGLQDSPAVSLETRQLCLKSLLGQARQLQALEACGYVAGNWQIQGAYALYELGLMLPWLAESKLWRETGERRLIEHILWDYNDDGGHGERCFGYSLGNLTRFHRWLRYADRKPIAGADRELARERIRRIEAWFLNFVTPNGVFIGVNDSGFESAEDWLTLLAAESNDGRYLWPVRARNPSAASLEPREPEFKSVHMIEDGWTILRDGWDRDSFYMAVNWGPWGSSHTHQDLLSINAYAFDQPMLIEAGSVSYDHPRDTWFRGPEAHNQVVIAGHEFDRRRHTGRVIRWRSGKRIDYFEGFHDAYRESAGIRLRRQILFVKGEYWLVVDTVQGHREQGRGASAASLLWHSVKPWSILERGSYVSTSNGPGVQLSVWPALRPSMSVGYENEPELYGDRYRVSFEQALSHGRRFMTLISPFRKSPSLDQLQVHDEEHGLVVQVERDGVRDEIFLRTANGNDVVGGRLRTDAALAWYREQQRAAAIIDGSRLSFGHEKIVHRREARKLIEIQASSQ